MTDRDHITAELRAVFDGQDIRDDAIRAVYLLGLRDGLSNPARARELTGVEESTVRCIRCGGPRGSGYSRKYGPNVCAACAQWLLHHGGCPTSYELDVSGHNPMFDHETLTPEEAADFERIASEPSRSTVTSRLLPRAEVTGHMTDTPLSYTDYLWERIYPPGTWAPRTLPQRIVGASTAEGAE